MVVNCSGFRFTTATSTTASNMNNLNFSYSKLFLYSVHAVTNSTVPFPAIPISANCISFLKTQLKFFYLLYTHNKNVLFPWNILVVLYHSLCPSTFSFIQYLIYFFIFHQLVQYLAHIDV